VDNLTFNSVLAVELKLIYSKDSEPINSLE